MESTRLNAAPRRRLPAVVAGVLLLLGAARGIQAAEAFVSAEVVQIETLAHEVKRVRVKLPADYSFEAGQFALMRVPPKFVEDWNARYGTHHGEIRRAYSFASSPSRLPLADFIIKLASPPSGKDVPPGICSSWVHQRLKAGDRMEIGKPLGSLSGIGDSPKPIVLVAGGTGVAPFVGLLEHWFQAHVNERRTIYLFMGVRQRRDLILHDQFTTWSRDQRNFHYIPALSNATPEDHWAGETGYIQVALEHHFPDTPDFDALLAGSPVMMREATNLLKKKGVPESQIRHDPIQVQ